MVSDCSVQSVGRYAAEAVIDIVIEVADVATEAVTCGRVSFGIWTTTSSEYKEILARKCQHRYRVWDDLAGYELTR